jgi:hypothetical protein
MLTAHELYIKARNSLFAVETNEDILQGSKTAVLNFLENQAIWDELNYYKTNGQLLGKHKMFSWLKRIQQIREMKVLDLFKLKLHLQHNLDVINGRIRKDPDNENGQKRIDRSEQIKAELLQINQMLNC